MNNFPNIYTKVISKLENNLPSWLHYHCTEHTKYVLEKTILIGNAEGISEEDLYLLKIAALYHDIGFIIDRKNHEKLSCEIATKELEEFGLTKKETETICNMMWATEIPQKPKTDLEKILADADLEYLGTDNFMKYGEDLYKELLHYNPELTRDQWNEIQYKFISNHHYHTSYCKQHREAKKLKNLELIKKQLNKM